MEWGKYLCKNTTNMIRTIFSLLVKNPCGVLRKKITLSLVEMQFYVCLQEIDQIFIKWEEKENLHCIIIEFVVWMENRFKKFKLKFIFSIFINYHKLFKLLIKSTCWVVNLCTCTHQKLTKHLTQLIYVFAYSIPIIGFWTLEILGCQIRQQQKVTINKTLW